MRREILCAESTCSSKALAVSERGASALVLNKTLNYFGGEILCFEEYQLVPHLYLASVETCWHVFGRMPRKESIMKDSKINNMFLTNEKPLGFLRRIRKGYMGDVMFLQKVYASAEYEEYRGKNDKFSFEEFFKLPDKEKYELLYWYSHETGHPADVGYARNDNGRRMDRVRHIRNAQLLKLSRRDSFLNREFKKLCSR